MEMPPLNNPPPLTSAQWSSHYVASESTNAGEASFNQRASSPSPPASLCLFLHHFLAFCLYNSVPFLLSYRSFLLLRVAAHYLPTPQQSFVGDPPAHFSRTPVKRSHSREVGTSVRIRRVIVIYCKQVIHKMERTVKNSCCVPVRVSTTRRYVTNARLRSLLHAVLQQRKTAR